MALGWLEEHDLPIDLADELTELVKAAYDDGVLTAQTEKPETREEKSVELTGRQQDALTLKALKILGSEARTHNVLRNNPYKLRIVASHAKVEPRVLRNFLDGHKTREVVASMIRRTLRELGFPAEPGRPS